MPLPVPGAFTTNEVSSGTSITLTLPSGVVEGDGLLVFVSAHDSVIGSWNTPAGWSFVQPAYASGSLTRAGVFFKIAGASEPNPTFTGTFSANNIQGFIQRVENVTGFDPENTASIRISDSSPATDTITTSSADCLVYGFLTAGEQPYGVPAPTSDATDVTVQDGTEGAFAVAYNGQPTAGLSSAIEWTIPSSVDSVVVIIALIGGAGGGGGGGGDPTPAFGNQHGQLDVAAGGSTVAITDVSSLDHTVVLNNNSRLIGGGPDGTSPNLAVDDASLGLRLTATDQITADRQSGASGTNRASWTAWTSVNPSGPNGFVVRDRRTVTLSAADSFSFTPAGVSDAEKVIPFITGIRNSETTTNHDQLAAATEINRTTGEVTIHGRTGSGTTTVEITTVEFTGSNWSVAYGSLVSTGDTGTVTLTAGVADWANAIIFHQFYKAAGGNGALSDMTAIYEPGANTTSVDWVFDSGADPNAGQRHTVYALHNTEMDVTRFSSTDSSAGDVDIDITSAGIADLAEGLVVVSAQTTGNGAAHLRGTRNAHLVSTTLARHYCHRSGNTMQIRMQVVKLPQDPAVTGGNVLKLRVSGVWVEGVLKERVAGVWVERPAPKLVVI